jgi:antitoxin component YwqK of YwqJK toxin-antitoxin module
MFGGQMNPFSSRVSSRVYFTFLVFEVISIIILIMVYMNINSKTYKSNNIVVKNGLIYLCGDSNPYTGKILDTLQSRVILEYDVVKGIKEGQFFISTMEGKFTVFGQISDNKNVGYWKYYYDSGKLQCTGYYDSDLPTGRWIWYYENGQEKGEGLYLKGRKDGKWIEYDENGYLKRLIMYDDDEVINKIEIHKPRMI